METLSEMYRIGRGPSSSHTIGPYRIMQWYIDNFKNVKKFKVILYGSLSLTGRGHQTDVSLKEAVGDRDIEIIWDLETVPDFPNTMDVIGYDENGKEMEKITAYSIGGGAIKIKDHELPKDINVYPQKNFKEIKRWCKLHHKSLLDYVKHYDGKVFDYLKKVWETMKQSILTGLEMKGNFKKPIFLSKKARLVIDNIKKHKLPEDSIYYAMAYGYAVGEVNVMHGTVVTAPTLGSAGLIPAVLYWAYKNKGYSEDKIIDALAVAGVVGNCFKTNGSIAGATGGCQAEIGSACSMAAAAYTFLRGYNIEYIEAAAIIAIEHHLGLTCDAILGHVYSPCIERNAAIAMRAILAADQSILTNGLHQIFDLDEIIEVQRQTGADLKEEYRETGLGGLSLMWKRKHHWDESKND